MATTQYTHKQHQGCKKSYYVSRADALRATENKCVRGAVKRKLSPYKCPHCDGYHLTSMTKAELRKSRKERQYHIDIHNELIELLKEACNT